MANKKRGISFEREIIKKCWEQNIAAHRIAGSGSSKYPSPDIIAFRNGKGYAIECKSTKNGTIYIKEESIKQLIKFSKISGLNPVVAIKFPRNYFFIHPNELQKEGKMFKLNMDEAKKMGKTSLSFF